MSINEARENSEVLGRLLQKYRSHLREVADRQVRGRLGARLDASDLIQQTFLEAHRCFSQFLGEHEPELVAWLRTILDRNISNTIRDQVLRQKRDIRKEKPLDVKHPNESTGPGQEVLAANHTSPSQKAMRSERYERLAAILATLPEDQRDAVRMRHLEGKSLAEIAKTMDRSLGAAAGLIKRGMQALRERMERSG